MPDAINLWPQLRYSKVLLDTSFAMHPGFGRFTNTFGTAFKRNPILIPALVLWELRKHSRPPQPRKSARTALQRVANLVRSGRGEVRFESCDRFLDLVILRVTLQHMLTHNLLVLTNDSKLMLDLRANWESRSVQTKRCLEVLKFRGISDHVCVFADETSLNPQHNCEPTIV